MAKNSTIENLQKVKKPIPHKTILIIILVLIVLAIIGTIKSCIEGDLDKSSNTIPSYEKEEIARMKENERIRDSIAIWRASLSPKEREALEKETSVQMLEYFKTIPHICVSLSKKKEDSIFKWN